MRLCLNILSCKRLKQKKHAKSSGYNFWKYSKLKARSLLQLLVSLILNAINHESKIADKIDQP